MKKGSFKKPRFLPVFTPIGAAVLLISLIILIRSLVTRNSYEIVITSFILLLLLILCIFGLWKSKKCKDLVPLWKPPYPMTAASYGGEQTMVSGLDVSVPLFFRLHFIIRGRFYPVGGGAFCAVFTETSIPRGETSVLLKLDFPVSGIFSVEGYCRLRDIFGLFSFSCGLPQQRRVNVRSSPCFGKNIYINAQAGAEDKKHKQTLNEERYYMREYTPGDRLRDINWKSSEKIDMLITRISTDNQEKVSRIEVYFRNFGSVKKLSLKTLWLLDRAKARLSYFLRTLQDQNPSYIFDVRTGSGRWEIDNSEALDNFFEELAGIGFLPPQNEQAIPVSVGELFVFSTACDKKLNGFITSCNPRPVTLFITQPEISAESRYGVASTMRSCAKDSDAKDGGVETLYLSDFLAKNCIPSPRLFKREKPKPLGAHAGRVESNFAGVKL